MLSDVYNNEQLMLKSVILNFVVVHCFNNSVLEYCQEEKSIDKLSCQWSIEFTNSSKL